MRALLLCAGIGARLRPLTDVLPKCLMPVNGEPLLGIWLRNLCGAGVDNVLVNLHHHADLVREYVRRSRYARQVTLVTEPQLLGTGGTLLKNRAYFGDAALIMAHADNLTVFDPRELVAAHDNRPKGCAMTMMTFITPTPRAAGIVELNDEKVVVGFHEKKADARGNLANAAVYVVEPSVFGTLASLKKSAIDFSTEVIPRLIGRIFTVHNAIYHRDIGTAMSLAQAQLEYPLFGGAESRPSERDPWYGLLSEHDGRLARQFADRITDAFATLDRDRRAA
jgi:mannose-1-phosphate guanylyltransferase